MTIQQLIKILPLEDTFKQDLLASWDSLDADQQINIGRMLWDGYYALYRIKLEHNIGQALLKAQKNEVTLDKDFYKRIRIETREQMKKEAETSTTNVDLEAARKAMESIVKEMKASKMKIKTH